jgi:hypothetical protein
MIRVRVSFFFKFFMKKMFVQQLWFYFLLVFLFHIFSCGNTSGSPVLGVVTLQKDEGALLSYWLEYHSKIVDIHNMIILDNFSEAPETLQILDAWAAKGLHVLFYQGPYTQKGELTSQAYQQILPHVDVIIPLDVDELLFAYDGEQPIVSKSKILSSLNEFWTQQNYSCLGLQQFYLSAVMQVNQTLETTDHFTKNVYEMKMAKKIGKARKIQLFDHGNHNAFFRCQKIGQQNCRENCTTGYGHLGLLHYHSVGPEYVVHRAIKEAISFGYLPSNFTLENAKANIAIIEKACTVIHPRGNHKLRELLRYVQTGPTALLTSTKHKFYSVDTLPEMIRRIEST